MTTIGGSGGSGSNAGPPRYREWKLGCKVYIGNLAEGVSKTDIEAAFGKFGRLRNVWVARNPPGFAFVEFEDNRDAEDACQSLDGTRIAGGRIKAEMSHGRSRRPGGGGGGPRGPPGGGYRGGPPAYGNSSLGGRGGYRGPPPGVGAGYNGDYYGGAGHHHHPSGNGNGGGGIGGGGGGGSRHLPSGAGGSRGMRPRSPGIKDFHAYSRSRSTSPIAPKAARPRTPPSRSITPDRC